MFLNSFLYLLISASVLIGFQSEAFSADQQWHDLLIRTSERLDRKINLYNLEAEFQSQLKAGAEQDLKREKMLGAVTTWLSSAMVMAPVVVVGGAVMGMYLGIAVDMGATGTIATTGLALVGIGGTSVPTYWVIRQGDVDRLMSAQEQNNPRTRIEYFDAFERNVLQISDSLMSQRAQFDENLAREFERADRSWTFLNIKPIRYAAAVYAKSKYMELWSRAVVEEMTIKRDKIQVLLRNTAVAH